MANIKDVLVVTVEDIYGKSSSELECYLKPDEEFDGFRLPKAQESYMSAVNEPSVYKTDYNTLAPRLIVKKKREPEIIKFREVIGAKEIKDGQYYKRSSDFIYRVVKGWKFDPDCSTDITVYEQIYD